MTETKVNRVIRIFDKFSDSLVEEIYINVENKSKELEILQILFGVEKDNLMYDCYPITTEEQFRFLALNFDVPLDTFDDDTKEYFLEADAVN